MMEFLSSDFVKLTVPLVAAVIAWFLNERAKRAHEEYLRKEQNYKTLVSSIEGFYVATQDTNTKQVFLEHLNQCWLYSPDEVIREAYRFLETVKTGTITDGSEKDAACGDFVAAIRRDLLSRRIVSKTKLSGRDFQHLRAT